MVPEETKKVPEERQLMCWYCLHNKVSTLCSNCLRETQLFESSRGKEGRFKPEWEYNTAKDKWIKGVD